MLHHMVPELMSDDISISKNIVANIPFNIDKKDLTASKSAQVLSPARCGLAFRFRQREFRTKDWS